MQARKQIFMKVWREKGQWIASALAVSFLSTACAVREKNLMSATAATTKTNNTSAIEQRVWPPAPEPPRIAWLQTISMPKDLGVKISGWSRFAKWITGQSKVTDQLNKPFGIAVDDADNLCLTDTGEACVCFFDLAHKKFQRWEKAGKLPFLSPVAVAKKKEKFFVADSGRGEVVVFNDKGKLLLEIKTELTRPSGLAISGEKLFVADAAAHCVVVFDLSGKFLFKFGRRGEKPGEFNFPTHVAADARGNIFITDSMNCRVEIFDTDGHFKNSIGGIGQTSGHFSRPKGVAADSFGHVYAIDALFDNLQIFDPAGNFLLDVGAGGSGTGEFWLPNGIAISRENRIYVADSYNHRVEVFEYIGQQ